MPSLIQAGLQIAEKVAETITKKCQIMYIMQPI